MVSDSKGGTFVIKPKGGVVFLRSMTKADFMIFQNFLPDYYKYILMNPNTYLAPILGVYSLQINLHGTTVPIYFRLTRNI